MTYCSNKDFNKLITCEIARGGRFVRGRKHGKLYLKDGPLLIFSLTPSDRRAIRNARARVARAHRCAEQT